MYILNNGLRNPPFVSLLVKWAEFSLVTVLAE